MIHVEKGWIKSILIDTESGETKECLTKDLENLDGTESLDVIDNLELDDIDKMVNYHNIDFHILENDIDFNKICIRLNSILSRDIIFFNYKLYLHNYDLDMRIIIDLIAYLNENYIHFGGLLIVKKDYLKLYKENFKNMVVIEAKSIGNDYYKPKFLQTNYALITSRKNNLYFYSRLIIDVYSNDVKVVDTAKFNISKNEIQICKDCQFKSICIDPRIIEKDKDAFFYNTTCAYDPYNDAWLDGRNEKA